VYVRVSNNTKSKITTRDGTHNSRGTKRSKLRGKAAWTTIIANDFDCRERFRVARNFEWRDRREAAIDLVAVTAASRIIRELQ